MAAVADKLEYLKKLRLAIGMRFQKFIDDSTPHTMFRWIFAGVLLLVYAIRVSYIGGFYVVTYAMGIYLLNILLAFLTPQVDPDSLSNENEGDGEHTSVLPLKADDEFRPFIRRLPEFKFWYNSTRAILISMVCTFLPFLNIPVFWPILLVYFVALFTVTMKKQIQHMIKHRYIPFTFGKPTFKKSNK